jgi:hypothetical protein
MLLLISGRAPAAELDGALAKLKSIGREGLGNAEASAAWKQVIDAGASALIPALTAFDGASPTTANWLRNAVDAIAETELNSGRKLPVDQLEAFVRQTQRAPEARRLAFDWLTRIDKSAPNRLLPTMLNDPSGELRRDAVAMTLASIGDGSGDKEKAALLNLLPSARDTDQVDAIAKRLDKLRAKPDLNRHYGFITRWHVSAPAPNTSGRGFHEPLPADLKTQSWTAFATADDRGMVNLYQATGTKHGLTNGKKDAVYALASSIVESPAERPVQIRVGSQNAIKVYLNGKEIFFREAYHHGHKMDQHIATGTLKAGRNEIIVKVCQDDRTESWTLQWAFQLRVCDDIGGAVPLTVTTALDAKPVPFEKPKKE